MIAVADYWLNVAANASPDIAGAGVAALLGDETAKNSVFDYAMEFWGAEMCPFEVGEIYLIQTVTLYYVGRVKRIVGAFVELEDDCSWIHWTGRLSSLCKSLKFTEGFASGDNKPRTEYIGRTVGLNMGSIVDYIAAPFDLPKRSIS
jgi:hypothetical protein